MYAKLFSSIVHSTIWREPDHVRLTWITMLALADSRGRVWASVPGLADVSRISVDDCRAALVVLKAPDSDSRDQSHEGRRIEDIDGGWYVLNYPKYRAIRNEEDRREQTRAAVRRHRAKTHVSPVSGKPNVSHSKPGEATVSLSEAETETEAKDKDLPRKKRAATGHDTWLTPFSASWETHYQGVAPFGPMAKALRPLVDRHGPESVLGAWNRYLAETDAAYASPVRFASTFGRWNGTAPPVGKQTQQERNLANIARGARELEAEEVARGEHESR